MQSAPAAVGSGQLRPRGTAERRSPEPGDSSGQLRGSCTTCTDHDLSTASGLFQLVFNLKMNNLANKLLIEDVLCWWF